MNKTTMGLILAAAGIFFMANAIMRRPPAYPPPPPSGSKKDVEDWVDTIISVYGKTRNLWAPGGPFYRGTLPENVDPEDIPNP